jgi:hypothetical protein
MSIITLTVTPSSGSIISYSKNFMIFNLGEKIESISSIYGFVDSVSIGTNDSSKLNRYVSYSTDGEQWSMWNSISNGDVTIPSWGGSVPYMNLNGKSTMFRVKYEYDDGTNNALSMPISVSSIKIRLESPDAVAPLEMPSVVSCSGETCLMTSFYREPQFRPYDVGSAVDMYKNMSFSANQMYGIEVVYFKAVPDKKSGDFIFKEWSLYNVVDRKCAKIMFPGNEFPDAKLYYDQLNVKYEAPVEVHIDNQYFQSIFGRAAEPRKADFMYIPMLNRMFEVQGSYVYRGFMMEPIYYRVMLIMFRPNIGYVMNTDDRLLLDNVLLNARYLFKDKVEEAIIDATAPQQLTSPASNVDPVRDAIDKSVSIVNTDINFNYSSLIDGYYDTSMVPAGSVALSYSARPVLSSSVPNITYTSLFSLNNSVYTFNFINGANAGYGFSVNGFYNNVTSALDICVSINSDDLHYIVSNIMPDKWYAICVTVSMEYSQVGIMVYDMIMDTIDVNNARNIVSIGNTTIPIQINSFDVSVGYSIIGSFTKLANIRVFKKMLQEDDIPFILSQKFIRDESMLELVDNVKRVVPVPFISKNR